MYILILLATTAKKTKTSKTTRYHRNPRQQFKTNKNYHQFRTSRECWHHRRTYKGEGPIAKPLSKMR